jgi:hypothetical protein
VVRRTLSALIRGGRAAPEPAPKPRKGIKRLSAATEAFFRTDGEHSGPLIIVFHIQKTGGTALREVVRTNLPPVDVEIAHDLRDFRYEPDALLNWHRDWYRALDEERRARFCCMMSHSAGYLLPALDRPAETLVVVREPVDRVLSFYWEKRRNFLKRRDPNTPFNLLEMVYATPPARRPPQSWRQFFNWQSRSLLSIFHDVSELPSTAGPSPDADLWRSRLRELVEGGTVFVGVQDRLDRYVDSLARRFGWETTFVPQRGVNRHRPRLSQSSVGEEREKILAYNWLDAELYELCREIQTRREAEEQGSGQAGP